MTQTCIIIGAGHVAAQLIPSLRQEGWDGEILLIGNEGRLPYHRPPLSKHFLSGEKSSDDLTIRPAALYEKLNVTHVTGFVTNIDRNSQSIHLEDGRAFGYGKLVICTGARVRKADFIAGSNLAGVHYMRHMADAQGIRQDACEGKTAVIIGGGYIGLETAASLRKLGMAVVVLEAAPRVLERVTAPEVSAFFTRIHTEAGVVVKTQVSVTHIVGRTRVQQVRCSDGTAYDADLVVIGIGVVPNVELACRAGLEVDNGIIVNQHCATKDPNIYAAGDCTNFYSNLYDTRLRLESVPNASEQAKVVAAVLCDKQKIHDSLPWFWSDQYDVKLQIAGLSQGYDRYIVRGDFHKTRSFAVFYFSGARLICADCINQPQTFMLCKSLISKGQTLNLNALADESQPLKQLIQDIK